MSIMWATTCTHITLGCIKFSGVGSYALGLRGWWQDRLLASSPGLSSVFYLLQLFFMQSKKSWGGRGNGAKQIAWKRYDWFARSTFYSQCLLSLCSPRHFQILQDLSGVHHIALWYGGKSGLRTVQWLQPQHCCMICEGRKQNNA